MKTQEFNRRHLRVLVQAGTMYWPRVTPEQDDGVCPTHFGFEWSPGTQLSQLAMEAGSLPEMHVWIALPDENTIIDLTTKYLPELCNQMIGHEWLTSKPPDYLWVKAEELPEGVQYKPDRDATMLAMKLMKNLSCLKENEDEAS